MEKEKNQERACLALYSKYSYKHKLELFSAAAIYLCNTKNMEPFLAYYLMLYTFERWLEISRGNFRETFYSHIFSFNNFLRITTYCVMRVHFSTEETLSDTVFSPRSR